MRTRTKLLSLVAVCSVLSLASSARAECREEDQKQATATAFHTEYVNGKPVLVIDDKIVICGRPARPTVAYITTPRTIDYTWESLEQQFLPRILDSVKQAPLSGGGSR